VNLTNEPRSRIFFQLQASSIGAEILGPPLGALLMEKNVWIPLCIGFGFFAISTFLALFLPETFRMEKSQTVPVNSGNGVDSGNSSIADSVTKLKHAAKSWTYHVRRTLAFIFSHRNLAYLIITFLVADFARQSLSFLLQYVSERYSIPLSKASEFPNLQM
jgi:MFS family permease